jgi:hypothetical protein
MTIKMHEFGILTSWLVDAKNKNKLRIGLHGLGITI